MTTTVEDQEEAPARRHVLQELGWDVGPGEDGRMAGSAVVVPEMHAPGTSHLRTSILAAWADVVAGYLAVETVGPRVPVTLELDVHLYRPAPAAGVAVLPHSDEVLNASNTINGGLIALAAEEAVLSLSPPGTSLASLDLRYLQPARVGPAVAEAEVRHGLGRVEVYDEGNDNRLCVVATTRAFWDEAHTEVEGA